MARSNKKSEIEKLKAEVERLKKELKKRKKYGLVWEDKPEDVIEMCKKKLPVLKEVKNKEIITDKNKPVNLLIEGDNYHALSVLNYTHAGKVDVIYIDPPYNTGNKDFIFNDHYVDREDAYRHSKWLSFMERRLKLAKNLLKDTGVIFISIDDNEVAQLKLLMDNPDLFGENNFVANIIWRKKKVRGRGARFILPQTEYILCYAKNINLLKEFSEPLTEKMLREYRYSDEKGKYKLIPLAKSGTSQSPRPNLFYKIKAPDGTMIPCPTHQWRWSKETLQKNIKKGLVVFKKNSNGKWQVFTKQYLITEKGMRFRTPESYFDRYTTTDGTEEIKNLFGKVVFDFPKPTGLIKTLIQWTNNKEAIVLDFMAGTGTTGHAVLALNKEDGGNRQFILCTNNENNICTDVCYPRIKKVIEGYKNLRGEWIEGLGGNLKYFKTDFVDYDKPTDRNKIKLTHQATEMLCVKEGTFEKVMDNERFKIFKNSDHYTGIIWDQTAIPEFKEVIKNIKAKFSVYIFSLTDETFDEEFADIKQKVKLSPIPEAILRVYRRIFR
jgi:adenine-specific DNA-methyltransferase